MASCINGVRIALPRLGWWRAWRARLHLSGARARPKRVLALAPISPPSKCPSLLGRWRTRWAGWPVAPGGRT